MASSSMTGILTVVILTYFAVPSFCYTQQLQDYTKELARKSYAIAGYFDDNSWLMRFGEPVFITTTFCVALYQFSRLLFDVIPGLRDFVGFNLPFLAQMLPSDMMMVRDGQHRDQRLLDHVDQQVKSAVINAQDAFENELKKKKK